MFYLSRRWSCNDLCVICSISMNKSCNVLVPCSLSLPLSLRFKRDALLISWPQGRYTSTACMTKVRLFGTFLRHPQISYTSTASQDTIISYSSRKSDPLDAKKRDRNPSRTRIRNHERLARWRTRSRCSSRWSWWFP